MGSVAAVAATALVGLEVDADIAGLLATDAAGLADEIVDSPAGVAVGVYLVPGLVIVAGFASGVDLHGYQYNLS